MFSSCFLAASSLFVFPDSSGFGFHADDSRRPELTLCQNDKKSVWFGHTCRNVSMCVRKHLIPSEETNEVSCLA